MKLTLKRQAFDKILSTLGEVIPSTTVEANFKNFLINVDELNCSILASDGNLSIQANIPLTESNIIVNSLPVAIQVPAKIMTDIIKQSKAEILTLELVDESLLYVSDDLSTKYELKVINALEYPSIDLSSNSSEKIDIKMSDFLSLYNCTYFATATKTPKELFKGINVSANLNHLTFVATDAYRLAKKYIDLPEDHHFSVTIPLKALSTVSHIETKNDLTLIIDNNKVLFKTGFYTISTKLYNGDFPNVDRIIPNDIVYTLEVNTKELTEAIARVTILGNKKIQIVHSDSGIEILTKDPNSGNASEKLPEATFSSNDYFSIICRADFLLDAINALNVEKAKIKFVSDTRAFLVCSDDVTNIQVITPVRSLEE